MEERICEEHNLPERYVIDPHVEELFGEIVWEWMCDECYRQRFEDI
ncbi:MAG TPA: hypothetical protein VMV41_01575 [Cellulomonadaceae bacterium]|nr:hypothetical protein [Cellulomonadaceae bacterium]